MAITHHIVVLLAAVLAGINPRTLKYMILGDDVVIAIRRQQRNILKS